MPPANDDFANAETLAIPSSTGGDNTGATLQDANEDYFWGLTVWYKWTGANQAIDIAVTSMAMSHAWIAVYRGPTGPEDVGAVIHDAYLLADGSEVLSFLTNPGATYYLLVDDGDAGTGGAFTLDVTTHNVNGSQQWPTVEEYTTTDQISAIHPPTQYHYTLAQAVGATPWPGLLQADAEWDYAGDTATQASKTVDNPVVDAADGDILVAICNTYSRATGDYITADDGHDWTGIGHAGALPNFGVLRPVWRYIDDAGAEPATITFTFHLASPSGEVDLNDVTLIRIRPGLAWFSFDHWDLQTVDDFEVAGDQEMFGDGSNANPPVWSMDGGGVFHIQLTTPAHSPGSDAGFTSPEIHAWTVYGSAAASNTYSNAFGGLNGYYAEATVDDPPDGTEMSHRNHREFRWGTGDTTNVAYYASSDMTWQVSFIGAVDPSTTRPARITGGNTTLRDGGNSAVNFTSMHALDDINGGGIGMRLNMVFRGTAPEAPEVLLDGVWG